MLDWWAIIVVSTDICEKHTVHINTLTTHAVWFVHIRKNVDNSAWSLRRILLLKLRQQC